MSYDEIPCPQCKSNLYFPGTTCSDCGYNDKEGVTLKGLQQVEQQHRRHQASDGFQTLYARGIQQRQSTTPPARSQDKNLSALFDAAYGSRKPSYYVVMNERSEKMDTLVTGAAADSLSNEPVAPRNTALEDDLRMLRERSRDRVVTGRTDIRRPIRRPEQKARRSQLAEKIAGPMRTRKKLSRGEYVSLNTHRLVSSSVDATNLSLIKGILCDHYDANRRGELSRCRQIREELANFLNMLQAAKLQRLCDWDSKLLAQFLIEKT